MQSKWCFQNSLPGFRCSIELVDGVEVHRGLVLRLASGEEHDPRHGGGHSAGQGSHSGSPHLLGAGLDSRGLAWGDHVGFEQRALQVHVVVIERLVHGGQHSLRHLLAPVQAVVSRPLEVWYLGTVRYEKA